MYINQKSPCDITKISITSHYELTAVALFLVLLRPCLYCLLELKELATSRLECVTQPASTSNLFPLKDSQKLFFFFIMSFTNFVATFYSLDSLGLPHSITGETENETFYKISKEETKHYKTNKQTNVKKKERITGQRKYRPLILHK